MTTRDRSILVTGATSNQGGATARHLLADGWDVRACAQPSHRAHKDHRAKEQKLGDLCARCGSINASSRLYRRCGLALGSLKQIGVVAARHIWVRAQPALEMVLADLAEQRVERILRHAA